MKYHFDTSLGRISLQISRALGRSFESRARQKVEKIRADQWSVISLLYHKGAQTQKGISDSLFMDKVAVSRLIDRLEKADLVRREKVPADKRANTVSLTIEGNRMYGLMEPLAREAIGEALKGMTLDETESLFRTLDRIKKNLRC